jgi:hypothetical protein
MKSKDILARYIRDLERVAIESNEELATRVIKETPKDTGSLQASWTDGINNMRVVNVDTTEERSSINTGTKASKIKLGDVFSLLNGQPYARRIEYEGHSQQAKHGMMRMNIAAWQSIVNGVL